MRALILAMLAGCGGATEASPDAAVAAKFSDIYPLIFPANTPAKCDFCHSQPASNISNGNLHMGMDKATAYAALVGKTATGSACMGQPLVVAGHPETSIFYTKLLGTPPCGERMPLGGGALPDAQIEMVRSWIAAGALDE